MSPQLYWHFIYILPTPYLPSTQRIHCDPMMVIKRLDKSNPKTSRSSNDQHMEDLMTAPPDIEFTRIQSLRDPGSIDHSSRHVEYALKDDPVETDALTQVSDAVEADAVQDGNDGGETHEGEE